MHHSKTIYQPILHRDETPKNIISYMPGLDGLRTLAVFAVIAYHLGLPSAPGGLLGVNLFFVLSGYLITNILFTEWADKGSINLKRFWIRRAKRLLPALFLMLAGILLWAIFFAPERLVSLRKESLAAAFYVGNWYLIFHEVSYFESFGPPSPLGHLWSLAIEEQFYLFWPILVGIGLKVLKKPKRIIAATMILVVLSAAAMALIYVPGTDPSRVYYGTDTRAFALLLGSMAAMVWPSGKMTAAVDIGKKRLIDGIGILSLAFVLWMIVKTNQYQPSLYQWGLLMFSIIATLLVVVLAHPASFLGKIFALKPLRLLGKWSYGIYLWHYPVIILSSPQVDTGDPDIMRCLWQTLASIVLAAMSYYIIEEPVRFKKMKPIILISRASLSLVLVFFVMMTTSVEGMQILAKDVANKESTAIELSQVADKEPEAVQDEEKDQNDAGSPDTLTSVDEDEGVKVQAEEIPGIKEAGEEVQRPDVKGDTITIITDSLLIDAKPMIEEKLPGIVIDTKKGRQMYDAPDAIDELRKKKELKETVILGLGSNGAFTEKQMIKTLDALEGAKKIIVVNTRVPKPWEGPVNETIAKVSESYPGIILLDWYQISKGHDEYFYKDGVHLTIAGMEAYYEMLRDVL